MDLDNTPIVKNFEGESEGNPGEAEGNPGETDMHKTSPYVRTLVTLHNLRDRAKDAVDSLNERGLPERVQDGWNHTRSAVTLKTRNFFKHPKPVQLEHIPDKYGYVFRQKSCWELVLLSGTVCGIEFCYSAETAFVTPILLSLGLNIKFVTMIWCLSPLIGFFLTPILGSMSDSCESRMGRRRPFILMYSMGILLGLFLVPNGHHIGLALGDTSNLMPVLKTDGSHNLMSANVSSNELFEIAWVTKNISEIEDSTTQSSYNYPQTETPSEFNSTEGAGIGDSEVTKDQELSEKQDLYKKIEPFESSEVTTSHVQPWSIAFTVIGTILLDFCSDACQSPSRTYLLDVSLPNDHAAGLSTFTLMAGLGGSMGYMMGAINWESTILGYWIGSQVNVVFTIVTVIFIGCLISTVCSFPEIPLSFFSDPKLNKEYQEKLLAASFTDSTNELIVMESNVKQYGATEQNNGFGENVRENSLSELPSISEKDQLPNVTENGCQKINLPEVPESPKEHPTLKEYLKSIVCMPNSLKILCLTNLFCWMSLVCYSLYFTDFVAECVFGGDPQSPEGSDNHKLYEDGVRFGCWGMALYSLSCAVYSYFIEALVKKIGAKTTYIGGQLVYSMGMVVMAITRHKVAVILLSPTAGVMYATLFTMPYLLIAHYHCTNKFSDKADGNGNVRGIGTDIAAVSSMVFLAQLILSLSMGSIVEGVGSNVATVCAAALLSGCGALSATKVMYLDI